MSSRWIGFFVWALVAASAAVWGVRIFAATRPVPLGAQAPQVVAANGPMERLFGAVVVPTAPVAPVHPESERFQLVGVIAPREGGQAGEGVAIVAIDGQPARAWHVGATLDGNTALLAVARRTADFGPPGGPAAFSLQLPEPAPPVTGSLAPAVSQPVPQQNPGVLPAPGVQPPIVQGSPQRENAQHVAQPQPPGMNRSGSFGSMRSAMQQGRPIMQQPLPGSIAPPRVATPAEPAAQGDGQPQQQ